MFKNIIYRMLLNAFNLVLPVFIGIYVARIFSLEAYGAFNTANADLSIFLIFGSFGIYQYGVREIGRVQNNVEKKTEIASTLFFIGFITNAVVLIVYGLYVHYFVDSNFVILYYILILQIIANIFNVEWVNEGNENYRFITLKTIVVRMCYVLCLFTFVNDTTDIGLYTFLLALSAFANNFISFIKMKRYFSIRKISKNIGKFIYPLLTLMFIININYLYCQLDKVLVSKVCGEVATTFYHIPHYILEMFFMLVSSMVMVTIPKLSFYSQENDVVSYNNLLERSSNQYFLFAMPIFIGIAAISYDVMYLYAPKYVGASSVLFFAGLYKVIASFEFILTNQVIYIKNKQNDLLKMMFIGGVLNVLANVVLIVSGFFDPATATIATSIVEIILVLMLYFYVRYKLNYNIKLLSKNKMLYIFLSLCFIPISLMSSFIIDNVILHALVTIICSAILYIGVLFTFKDDSLLFVIENIKKRFFNRRKV